MRVRAAAITISMIFAACVAMAPQIEASEPRCGFAQPKKARKFQADLVPAFLGCGGFFGSPPSPNTATEDGVPACQPPLTFDTANGRPMGNAFAWLWDDADEGKRQTTGKVQLKSAKNKCTPADEDANGDCVNLPDPLSSADAKIRVNLTKVEDGSGALAGSGQSTPDGTFAALLRMTGKDREGGDMTLIDTPVSSPIPMINGKARLKTTVNALLNEHALGDLPDCLAIEVVALSIADPNGNGFASPGLFLPEVAGGD